MNTKSVYFDKEDHDLLAMVNSIVEHAGHSLRDLQLFAPELHPHGIKELAISREMRVAYAVVNLLNSLEVGEAADRIAALRSLHNEVLFTAASTFRRNTARVLIQIMKDLVRAHGDPERQLMLAHDFRAAATGKRRVVRAMLRRYHLLEMPEAWDQLTFDNHVHDANTKGRKTPTHLIMDAWIKGIRSLTVIYYNFVEPHAVQELIQASDIMHIETRVGIEFKARFRDRYVDIIWEPVGLDGATGMEQFLNEEPMRQLMHDGRAASLYNARHVFAMLERYNSHHRFALSQTFGIELSDISKNEFMAFVAAGQPSLLHLAERVYKQMLPLMARRLPQLREAHAAGTPEEKQGIEELIANMHTLHPELIMETYFTPEMNPELLDPDVPQDGQDVPDFLKISAQALVSRLHAVRPLSRKTLTLSGLLAGDMLELVYDCEGRISHLELFNLKDYNAGKMPHAKAIADIMYAVNQGSSIALKRLIRSLLREFDDPLEDPRGGKLVHILHNIPKLIAYYKGCPLKTRIGSDSTSRSFRLFGMGFAYLESLPRSARKRILDPRDSLRQVVPLHTEIDSCYTYSPPFRQSHEGVPLLTKLIRLIPGQHYFGYTKKHSWEARTPTTRYAKQGTIATLGGFQRSEQTQLTLKTREERTPEPGIKYLNSRVSDTLKVLIGFMLTMGSFHLTQSWWVLIWFGAPIWFAITGLRNILQSVLGGGGIRRTPLLKWNAYISWSRIADSLLFTGISVPLLEVTLRWWLMDIVFGVTAVTNPFIFYTFIAAANGLYIASHNIYRGLPKEAIIGNLFRSVLTIPLALACNTALMWLVIAFKVENGLELLVASSTIVSKAASDTVASVIEGIGDLNTNLWMRRHDYNGKLKRLFSAYSRLEELLPEEDVLEVLRTPLEKQPSYKAEVIELQKAVIIHALDLMFFWMYQPRARTMLHKLLHLMTRDERIIFVRSQAVLYRTKEVSRMFVDGIVGGNFSRALSFFLDRHQEYLGDISHLSKIRVTP